MTLVRRTKEDAQQIWSGEEEGKGPNKAQKNAATGECPFCFYNILHVTIVSMKTVILPCVWVMSHERVPLSRVFISGFFSCSLVDFH